MGWIVLLMGLALWFGAHVFKRAMPERRAGMGDAGKGVVAAAILAGIVLMVLGYRWTPFVPVWNPPSFLVHINNLLVLIAFYLLSPAPKKGRLFHRVRHPMLTGFGLWAVAHLLVNGDLTAIVTFGVLLIWAVVEIVWINAAEPDWEPNPPGAWKWDGIGLAGAVILVAVVGYIHAWLGVWPFA